MRERWQPVAVAIVVLLGVNLAARLAVRLAGPGNDAVFVIGLWSLGAMVVALAVATFLWTKRYLVPRVLGDVLVVIGVSALLVTLVGPFVSGGAPFDNGFGGYLIQLGACIGVQAVGATLGLLLAMALGLDPKSRAWKRQAQSVKTSSRQRQGRSARR
jgi:hypothetical protein